MNVYTCTVPKVTMTLSEGQNYQPREKERVSKENALMTASVCGQSGTETARPGREKCGREKEWEGRHKEMKTGESH